MHNESWGSDVPISMPQALTDKTNASVPMFGFRFTQNGLMHDMSKIDWDRLATPSYAPEGFADQVRGDLDVDGG